VVIIGCMPPFDIMDKNGLILSGAGFPVKTGSLLNGNFQLCQKLGNTFRFTRKPCAAEPHACLRTVQAEHAERKKQNLHPLGAFSARFAKNLSVLRASAAKSSFSAGAPLGKCYPIMNHPANPEQNSA
jgi:hypothetical protein